ARNPARLHAGCLRGGRAPCGLGHKRLRIALVSDSEPASRASGDRGVRVRPALVRGCVCDCTAMTELQPAVRVEGVFKRFGATTALAGVDLVVPEGMVFGLLGPNGAGKTTLIRILATLLEPDAGRAELLGHDVVREAATVREQFALTGQFAAVDELLTGRENLQMFG